ncbi:autorepressor SdpR family transcription factor [Desulforamulus hydrothermalis]|uniref:Transcriptional repressor sdpR n=1 Tax=Desulforamulus hydrothermalis Lam5 = DSM 18033 TaxID=1121428 RepID=K8DXT0_9FIRM|nr:autorepressor SdpR family transcription factor [Desulforamulus hydrothermalis]CCO07444.1 Transcriptional repressor sdpR [Desulforamulus hydrothermalis Lam5 = DSM 18033]SHH18352.1 DNA-binding transcriptional regulator, ArsR family [Desulforamulus hydrothermalis Lam5 = DSM 18033]
MSGINSTFQALSDPTRREILKLLRQKDLTAGEIAEHFRITKPSISHHLNVLKNAQLVLDERKGQYIYYSLNTSVLDEVMSWFADLLQKGGKIHEI